MYTPPAFAASDPDWLAAFIRANDFGVLVSRAADGLAATHIPFLLDRDRGCLLGHVARANGQWRGVEDAGPVLVVFSGPHGYVSPRWYETAPAVPTWNYEAVHVAGRAKAIHDPAALRSIVDRLSRVYETGVPSPWTLDAVPADFVDRQLKGIVGIEVAIERIEGKRKLSQNRTQADRDGVIAALELQEDGRGCPLAAAMRETR